MRFMRCYDCASGLVQHASRSLIDNFGTVLADNDGKARRQRILGASKRWPYKINKNARATMPSAFGRTCDRRSGNGNA